MRLKLTFSLSLGLLLCSNLLAAPLLNILQVECVRKGTSGYKPKSALPYIDLSSDGSKQIDPDFSDHATAVAGYWQAGGTSSLVNQWYVCESVSFEIAILKAGKTLPPLPSKWQLAILPYGQNCTWTDNSIYSSNRKLAQQAERDNVLVLVSPPDAGQGFFGSPCLSVSPNIIHVASSVTGSDMAGMPANELYTAVAWNSYVQPEDVSLGIAQILDWLLKNSIPYSAADIKTIILSTAQTDSQGHKIFNGSAAIAAVKAKYGAPVAAPLPPAPVVEPVVTPVPIVTPQPTTTILATPTPSPVPATTTDAGAPQINSWGHWNSAWASPTTPATLYWTATHCTAVTIIDPNGKQLQEPNTGTLTVTTSCSGSNWTITATNGGQSVSKTDQVHGCL